MRGLFILGVSILMLGGCTPSDSKNENTRTGNNSDGHKCIGSAGFSWCAKTNKCERPWELAKKEKFEKSAEAFKDFCGN